MGGYTIRKYRKAKNIYAPASVTASAFNTLLLNNEFPFLTNATASDARLVLTDTIRVNAISNNPSGSEIRRLLLAFDLTGINKNATAINFVWERISGIPYDFAIHSTTAVIPAVLSDYSNKTALIGIDNTTVSLNTIVDFNASGVSYFNAKKGGIMYVLIEDKQYDYNLVAPAIGTGNLNTATLNQLKIFITY